MSEDTDIRVMLATLATDMKSVKEDVADIKKSYREDVAEVKATTVDHDKRLRDHDVSLAKIWGAVAILTLLVTAGIPLAAAFIH